MFCSKCGSEIAGNSSFCPICGSRIEGASQPSASYSNPASASGYTTAGGGYSAPQGGYSAPRQSAPAGSAYSNPQPGYGYTQPGQAGYRPAARAAHAPANPLVQESKGFISAFITPGNQLKALGSTLDYKSFGGIIIAAAVSVFSGLAAMVNINQIMVSATKKVAQGYIDSASVLKIMPSGANLFLGILSAFMIFLAASAAVTVAGRLSGGNISFISAMNLVGFSSLPLLAVYILDLLLGLIWFPLPYILSAVALMAVCVSIFAAFVGKTGSKGLNYIVIIVYTAIIVAVTVIFSYIWVSSCFKGVYSNIQGLAGSFLGGLF